MKGRKIFCSKLRKSVTLLEKIASSGEGEVWKISDSKYLAKIYHQPTIEREEKLNIMINNPPPKLESLAWPYSLVYQSRQKQFLGFLMPYIKDAKPLHEVYLPKLRKKLPFLVNWKFLHKTALNLVTVVKNVHDQGYVIGDMKHQNILVNSEALPTIIDIDSFQVIDPKTHKIHPCGVLSEGFNPPELLKELRLGKDIKNIQQYQTHDNFRLAVIIYFLIFGYHPFSGEWVGSGEKPNKIDDLVENGDWPYGKNSRIRPGITTIPFDVQPLPFYSQLKTYFLQCFNEGHNNPNRRPTAKDWENALEKALKSLVLCDHYQKDFTKPFSIPIFYERHYYEQNYQKCYWCERAKPENLGVDVFGYIPIYNKLEEHLKSKQWKDANLATVWIILQVMDGKALLNPSDYNTIQGFDLVFKKINKMWLKYSSNEYGFTVQKEIYDSLFLNLNNNQSLDEIFNLFTKKLGWEQSISNRRGYFPHVTNLLLKTEEYINLLELVFPD